MDICDGHPFDNKDAIVGATVARKQAREMSCADSMNVENGITEGSSVEMNIH